MSIRMTLIAFIAAFLTALSAFPAHAETSASGQYAAGWDMVGGPPGTLFSAASALDVYNGTAYSSVPGLKTELCNGYWAYFPAPASITLNGTPATGAQTCAVQSGWNLVGNPYLQDAVLPAGTVGYYWNASAGRYDTVSSIPVGAAVWINASSAGSVMLQPAQATIVFGREGGNIRPYQVTVSSNGTVTVSGAASSPTQLNSQQVSNLLTQVQNAGFLSLPPRTDCPGTLPDVASRYIEINAASLYRVEVHGDCVPAFNQLFAALAAATGTGS